MIKSHLLYQLSYGSTDVGFDAASSSTLALCGQARILRGMHAFFSLILGIAQATSFAPREFTETVADAPYIVRGKIGTSSALWAVGSDGVRRIYTYTELAVEETLRGEIPKKTIQVREMGGEKDGVGMDVPGSARFETGEEVVLFLMPANTDASYDVKGLMMSKLNVKKDKNGQEYLDGPAIQAQPGKIYHDHDAEHLTSDRPVWTYAAFKSLVADQKTAPQSSNPPSQSVKNPVPTPTSVGITEENQTQTLSEPPAASPTPEQERNSSWGFWILLIFVTLGVGIALLWLLRRRK